MKDTFSYRQIALIIFAIFIVIDCWIVCTYISLDDLSSISSDTIQFIITVHIAFIIPMTITAIDEKKKTTTRKWTTSLIVLNVHNIHHTATIINNIYDCGRPNFNININTSKNTNLTVNDHLSHISINIEQILDFAYAFALSNNYDLTQNIVEMFPAIRKNLQGLYPYDPELLKIHFEKDWLNFYLQLNEFCEYIKQLYGHEIDYDNNYTCSFIQNSMGETT